MKKICCILLTLIFILALSACVEADVPTGTMETFSDPPAIPVSFPGTSDSVPSSKSLPEQNLSQAANPANCTFDPAKFCGKIKSCAYAGDGKLFVVADKLYLYDTTTASVLAATETPLSYFDVQIIDGGYLLSGMGDDGMMAYVYDKSLSLNREIAVNELLTEDFVVSEIGVAASTDGKKLAIASLRGVYLYDLEAERLTTLLDSDVGTSAIRLSMLYGLAFVQDNSRLAFYGGGFSVPKIDGENSFFIYGSMAVDGSDLKLAKSSAEDMEEIQRRGCRLFFTQTFSKKGPSLWLDGKTGDENTISYITSDEGRDGVYSSEQGKYVATAVLDGSLTVRVYDVDSGELIGAEVIENADSTYFNRIPQIYLLEGSKTAVVLLGGSINEIDTLVSTFTFGESHGNHF